MHIPHKENYVSSNLISFIRVIIAQVVEHFFVAEVVVGSNLTIHPNMSTLNQIIKNPRKRKLKKSRAPAFEGAPIRKGICLKVLVRKPKKPNSALRQLAKVKLLSTKKTIYAAIPGEGHTLQTYGSVLVRGGRVRDLPGVRYKCIRGKYDLLGVVDRCTSRSKYGRKKMKV